MKQTLRDLYYEISADIEHGECFYDKDMFKSFIENVERLKEVAQKLHEEYQNSEDDEEDEY